MSFDNYKKFIEYGDTAILHLGFNRMLPLRVEKGKVHQTRFGALQHNKLKGKRYGQRIECTKGFVYILHPTPELWTLTLPHRTQILYSTDISMITMQLDLRPGSTVIEAGTGSGSLSHAILRTIAPTGHLHTFDFHAERVELARKEFKDHGLENLVTARHRDVCQDGFELHDIADAVFLDLPNPWQALPHAKKSLKKSGGRLCTFSPCIEQVQRSCDAMTSLGFTDIQTMEFLVRDLMLQTVSMETPGPMSKWQVPEITVNSRGESEPGVGVIEGSEKSHDNFGQSGEVLDEDEAKEEVDEEGENEEENMEEDEEEEEGKEENGDKEGKSGQLKGVRYKFSKDGKRQRRRLDKRKPRQYFKCKGTVSRGNAAGHTGYLTFASLYCRKSQEVDKTDGNSAETT